MHMILVLIPLLLILSSVVAYFPSFSTAGVNSLLCSPFAPPL